jgi:regulatory protein
VKKRVITAPTPASLERSAQWQLSRRAMTVAQLRTSLLRKLQVAVRAGHTVDDVALKAAIEALLVRYQDALLLDDARVGAGMVRSLRTQGKSARAIGMKLKMKGVEGALTKELIRAHDDDRQDADGDFSAAMLFVKRRRLLTKEPQKAMAALARQGFSFDVCRRALAASRVE